MAYADLREFIADLEKSDELLSVPVGVDWKYEVSGWIRKSADMRPKGPALLFENIKGYPRGYRLFAGGVASYRRFAIALGLSAETPLKEIIRTFRERIKNPRQPRMVNIGPVKENVLKGEAVDLLKFPVPWWTPRDGCLYIGTWHGNVTKDPETGSRNVGTYRVMVHDRNHAGVGFLPFSHLGSHYAKCERVGKPLEMAVVIGADETVPMVAGTGFPPGIDEFTMAGALREEPLELVKCETVDLEVPANAEIVLEGLILPRERRPEGPIAEHTGYYAGGVRMRPVFEITAITHRNNPILRGTLLGRPTMEDHIFYSVTVSAVAMQMFETQGPEGVTAVHCPPEGDSLMSAIIQMRPHYVGHSRNAARALISSSVGRYAKYVIVVDPDIDPFDLGQVWWALTTRTQGSRDIEVIRFATTSRSDPSVPRDQAEYGDKVIIDATKRMQKLIRDLLAFSRTGRVAKRREKVSPSECA